MEDKNKTTTKKTRITGPVKVIVKREFTGEKSLEDAFSNVIYEDLRKKIEKDDTFDSDEEII